MKWLAAAFLGVLAARPATAQEVRNSTATVTLGDPIVVAQAPPEVKSWGPWQFPHLERLQDGRLHVDYHIEKDSATAYGKPVGHAYSKDEGRTWLSGSKPEEGGGLLLSNGDRIRPYPQASIPVSSLKLPNPLSTVKGTYGVDCLIYSPEQVPIQIRWYRILRMRSGAKEWVEEYPAVRIPGEVYGACEGVLVVPNFDLGQTHWHLLPDKTLLAAVYTLRRRMPQQNAPPDPKLAAVFIQSRDQGQTWDMLSEIPYQPVTDADAKSAQREGFSEPDFCVLPDRSLLCLLRTTDGLGVGPLYASRSKDSGKSWSRPEVFDDLGVWPVLLTLKNGITLAAYGRPGLFLRAAADPAGKDWDPRVEVIKPDPSARDIHRQTCSYADLLAVDEQTAYLVYSDFRWPDKNGRPCKTILFRSVSVRRR